MDTLAPARAFHAGETFFEVQVKERNPGPLV